MPFTNPTTLLVKITSCYKSASNLCLYCFMNGETLFTSINSYFQSLEVVNTDICLLGF